MNVAYLLIGGNMGDRLFFLAKARDLIGNTCGTILKMSGIYETEAWGMEEQDSFLNQAIMLETKLNAQGLLQCLLDTESSLGRIRGEKYGPRLIDIDILFFNRDVISTEHLKVPHPLLQKRRFVLMPLNEIAAGLVHPVFNKSISQLLDECNDPLDVVFMMP